MACHGYHDRAFILSTGDEIITGQQQDTNAKWLAEQLVAIGIMPVGHEAVPDSLPELVSAIRRAVDRAPLVIMSGGLGPTDGDLTRTALCEVLGEPLVLDEQAQAAITAMLSRRGREVSERQLRQAHRPRSAVCLMNAFGTAPGLHARRARAAGGSADVFALPGPPGELRPMFERQVRPALRLDPGRTVRTRLAHIVGVPEADCVARLGDLTRRDRVPLVGITASGGILTLRVRYEGTLDAVSAERAIDDTLGQAKALLGDHLFASGPGVSTFHLAAAVIELLKSRGETLAVVESCTGGMLGEMITAVPGSSSAFAGGYITYANELKTALGVEGGALAQHGAVSAVVADQMARRGRERARTSHALAITGIAGPDGGSEAKPVGTVHVGLCSHGAGGAVDEAHTRHFLITGDRDDVRRRAAVSALAMLYFRLRGRALGEPRLLWQVG